MPIFILTNRRQASFFLKYKILFSVQILRTEKIQKIEDRNEQILRTYCLIEYELGVIDELDTCGLIERRGTSC